MNAQAPPPNTQLPQAPPSFFGWLRRLMFSGLGRQVAGTLMTRMGVLGIGVIIGGLTARLLGPGGRGVLATAEAVAAIGVQFGILGLHAANTHFVARDRSLLTGLLGNSFRLTGVVSCLLAGVYVLLLLLPGLAPLQGLLLALAFAAIPVRLLTQLLQSLLIGVQDVRAVNATELACCLLSAAVILPFLIAGWLSPEVAFALSFAGSGLAVAVLWWRLRRYASGPAAGSTALLRSSLGYGIWLYVACLLMYLVLKIDVLMLKYLQPGDSANEQVGYYSVSVALGDLVCLVPTIVGSLLFPRLSAPQSPAERWRTTRQAAWLVAAAAATVGGALALLAGPLVRLIYGEPFLPAVPGFWLLMPGVVCLSVNVIFMNYFAANGALRIIVWSPAVGLALNVAVNFLAIPRFGFLGAAAVSTACYVLLLGLSLAYSSRTPEAPGR